MIWTHVAAALIAAAVAFTSGWKVNGWRHDSAEKQRIEDTRELARLNAKTSDKASTNHESFKENERVIYQTITKTVEKIVERPVYRNICFDDDGLRQLNSAVTGAEPAASKPAPAVP